MHFAYHHINVLRTGNENAVYVGKFTSMFCIISPYALHTYYIFIYICYVMCIRTLRNVHLQMRIIICEKLDRSLVIYGKQKMGKMMRLADKRIQLHEF